MPFSEFDRREKHRSNGVGDDNRAGNGESGGGEMWSHLEMSYGVMVTAVKFDERPVMLSVVHERSPN